MQPDLVDDPMVYQPKPTLTIPPGSGVTPRHPVRIGPYKILGVLGEGGMGVVYDAEQTTPIRRRVALKLIKSGLDTGRALARFESERQALALLDHPHIAKVLEAGSTKQGHPFFVMEYVSGEAITDYCDRHRLPMSERLELFIRVTQGVEHAHLHGIIHRDIKPTNLLVTVHDEGPVPKVIDFGVAKATSQPLTDRTLHTEYGQMIGTPEYMSPEQAEMTGLEIDSRTDIYSLGVVLYELLVGALPFDSGTLRNAPPWEVHHIIRDKEPDKPSTRISSLGDRSTLVARHRCMSREALVRELRGDLDWIVMKAMDKDRTRRYPHCKDMADDIRRHLDHVPVHASPPSWGYRASKFVRRRRAVIAVCSLFLLLTGAVGLGAWSIASMYLKRATARMYVAEGLLRAFEDPEDAIRFYDQALELWPGNVEAQIHKAYALRRANRDPDARLLCAEIIATSPDLAAPAHMLMWQLLLDSDPAAAHLHLTRAEELADEDQAYYRALALSGSDPSEAISLLIRILEDHSMNLEARWALAWCYKEVGDWQAMLQVATYLTTGYPDTATYWNAKAIAHAHLNEFEEALDAFAEAIARKSEDPFVYLNRAQTYLAMNQPGQALEDCRRSIALDPSLADAHALQADARIALNQLEEAEASCREALAIEPDNSLALRNLGEVLARRHDYASALDVMERGMSEGQGLWGDYHLRGMLRRVAGHYEDAIDDLTKSISGNPKNPFLYLERAMAHRFLDDADAAIADLRKAAGLDEAWAFQCHLWTWEIRALRKDPDAGLALEDARRAFSEATDPRLFDAASSNVTAEQILSTPAIARDEALVRTAHYYLGVRELIAGNRGEAIAHFQHCYGRDLTNFPEIELSKMHLERLEVLTPPPPDGSS